MAISRTEVIDQQCPSCGRTQAAHLRVVADLIELPDLRARHATNGAYLVRCGVCRKDFVRDAPLVVIGVAEAAPVVVACSDAQLMLDDPFAPSQLLANEVQASLEAGGRSLPGPMLVMPFDVMRVALGRDVDADVAGAGEALAEVSAAYGEDAAERYAIFLSDIEGSEPDRRFERARIALGGVSDAAELRLAASRHPDLISERLRRYFEDTQSQAIEAQDELGAEIAASFVRLLSECAAGQFELAWDRHEAQLRSLGEELDDPQLEAAVAAFDQAFESGDLGAMCECAEYVLPLVKERSRNDLEARISYVASTAYHDRDDGDLVENLERCCVLLERILEIASLEPDTVPTEVHTQVLLNLGASVSARYRGDPAANQERAIALTRRVLERVGREEDGHTWAMAHTNLGLNLLEREVEEDGDSETVEVLRRARLEEAIQHYESALEWRSFERDPGDYAYTQVNLALAYHRLGDRFSLETALEHSAEAIRGFRAGDEPRLLAQALANRSASYLQLHLDDSADGAAPGDDWLEKAEHDIREAITAGGDLRANIGAGQRWSQLARILAVRDGYATATVEAFRAALASLTPTTAPRSARDAATRLGGLAADAGDWPVAAEAYEVAALAAAAAGGLRATRVGRLAETTENGAVFRWAAFALAREGRPARAVEMLELGRARLLAAWLEDDGVDLRLLREADPVRCALYLELRENIREYDRNGAGFDDQRVARAREELTAVVDELRMLPGMGSFLRPATSTDIAAALHEHERVAYPLTTPWGSCWLLVGGGVGVQALPLPELTSTEIVNLVIRREEHDLIVGYLPELHVTGDDLDEEIDLVASTLGPKLMAPLATALRVAAATHVVIVPPSILGQLPLSALTWTSDGGRECLLDSVAVTHSPSGYVHVVARERAQKRIGSRQWLVVGNPMPQADPLEHAELEALAICDLVPDENVTVLTREEAVKAAVVAEVARASHIHLACHGYAVGDLAKLDGGLVFAHDESLVGSEILELDLGAARLVVASACETGQIVEYDTSDEAVTVGTLFLAAGAAGAVSTLWQVDDYATALLMVRFYEEVLRSDRDPAAALRAAQLWLRDLDLETEDAYLQDHAMLRAHRQARFGSATRSASRNERGGTAGLGLATMWAAFVYTGG